jgi:signal transduction histidine kinase
MRDDSADLLLPRQLSRSRLAPWLLGLVLVVVATSFYLADLSMRRAGTAATHLHEQAVGAVVAEELTRQLEWLRAFYEATGEPGNRLAAPLNTGSDPRDSAQSIAPLTAIAVGDSTGRLLLRIRTPERTWSAEETGSVVLMGEDERQITIGPIRSAVMVARGDSIASVVGLRLVVSARSPQTGAARILVGMLSMDSLRKRIHSRLDSLDVRTAIVLIGHDSIALVATASGASPSPVLPVRLATLPAVSVASTFSDPPDTGRIALWCMAIGAMMALFIGLLMDRNRVRRMAERSTELEHLSAELLRANRAKSEFLANVSHELRTPLNAIVGFVDLLRDGVYGELAPRQVGPVSRIEASATHLRHMVDQILDLAKMAAGRLEVHAELVDLRPFVLEVAGEMEPLLTEKGLTLSIAVGATLPKVRIDPAHLRQILVNLLGNAVKFTSVGGVSIRARNAARREVVSGSGADRDRRHEGPWVALQVIDSGIGIPRRDWERIFDEFEQVNAGPRGDSIRRGTGLGLSISRRLARLMDGDVTLESEEGKGSVFTVWLPAEPRAGTSATPLAG